MEILDETLSEHKPFAIALDENNKPCVLTLSEVREETSEIPSGIKRKLILEQLTGKMKLSSKHLEALGIQDPIYEIELILDTLDE